MEGISTVTYQERKIYVINFSMYGKSKEDTIGLITAIGDLFVKEPLNSVLAVVDISNAFFHWDTFKAIRELIAKTGPYSRKIALIGVKGMRKTSLKTLAGNNEFIRSFDTEEQAREWLISG